MQAIIREYLSSLEPGELQEFGNMSLFPIFSPRENGQRYITMKDALGQGALKIMEMGVNGSVPELRAVNRGDVPVLLLDGEELAGAKQNRVLNTTILLKERSETIIPVSCTEQGRWSSASPAFCDSGIVMSPRIRKAKSHSVTMNVETSGKFQSNQSRVWQDIQCMAGSAEVRSPTGAMKDIHAFKEHDLGRYMRSFELIPGQKGLLVLIGGRVEGFDAVSRAPAYAALHEKLVKSYAMDALLREKRGAQGGEEPPREKAMAFIGEAAECRGKGFPSVGLGTDVRFRSGRIVGSSLVYRDSVIHAAFFRSGQSRAEGEHGNFTSFRSRRDFREGSYTDREAPYGREGEDRPYNEEII